MRMIFDRLRSPFRLGLMIMALIVALGLSVFGASSKVKAITVMPGQSVLNGGFATVPAAGQTADGKYAVIAKISDKTELKGLGDSKYMTRDDDQKSVGTELSFSASAAKGTVGALYTNIASMNGRELDLAVVATDWTPTIAGFQFRSNVIGVDLHPIDQITDFVKGVAGQFKFTYLDHITHVPVQVGGYYTFNDIDWGQSIGITASQWAHVDKVYVPTDQTILQYLKTDVGSFVFEPESGVGTSDDDPTSQFTMLYNNVTDLDLLFTSSGDARTNLGNFSTKSTVNYANATDLSRLKDVEGNVADAFFGYTAYKPLRTATTTPAKTVSDSDEKQVTKNTLLSRADTNTWEITQIIPDEYPQFYYSEAYMSDNVGSIWNVTNVIVTNENGQNVTSWFPNQGTGNNFKLAATSDKLKSADFYGHTYTFTITAKLKPGAKLDGYLSTNAGGYVFNNQGSFTTDTGTKPTNLVSTVLQEDQLTIHKVNAANTPLSGVVFALSDSVVDAKAGKFLKLDADGNVVYPSDSNYSDSLKDYTQTTDANGDASWSGLVTALDLNHQIFYKELKTAPGYKLLMAIGTAPAGPVGTQTILRVENDPDIRLPQTGSHEQLVWQLIVVLVVTIAGGATGLLLLTTKT